MKNEVHRFKGILFGFLILASISLQSQTGVYVSLSVDNENPTGFCDILTYTMLVRNFDAPSTMTGRIEYNQNDFIVSLRATTPCNPVAESPIQTASFPEFVPVCL